MAAGKSSKSKPSETSTAAKAGSAKARKERNRLVNESLHKAKVAAGGLGRRELRRIKSGVRKQK